jgi:hypothetical protein
MYDDRRGWVAPNNEDDIMKGMEERAKRIDIF